MRLISLCLAVAIVAIMPGLALAQEAAGTVNLSPVVQAVVGIVGAVVTALAGVAGMYLKAKWGIDLDLKHNAVLNDALEAAADFAVAKLPGRVRVDNDLLRLAAGYVAAGAPKAMAYLGVTPARIEEMVAGRVAARLGVAPQP